MRNVILTTFSQQFRSDRLLFAPIGRKKRNFSDRFKLKLVTILYIEFVVKVL